MSPLCATGRARPAALERPARASLPATGTLLNPEHAPHLCCVKSSRRGELLQRASAFFVSRALLAPHLQPLRGNSYVRTEISRLFPLELPEPLFFARGSARLSQQPRTCLLSPPLTHAVKVSQRIAIGFGCCCGCMYSSILRSSALGQNKRA